jgi:protein-disulfide isomerase
MTKKIYSLAFLIIVSLVLYAYLTKDYYAVQYGTATGDSICSINDTFNCEAVAASRFSSLLFGIPNSILGFMLSFVMLISLFGILISSDDQKGNENWLQFFGFLATINLGASLLMGAIALFAMDVYCLFCICLYILSFLIYALFKYAFSYKTDFKAIKTFASSTAFLILLFSVPALSYLGHKIIKNEYSPAAQEKEIKSLIKSWSKKEKKSFGNLEPLFTLNPGGRIKLKEFADFLCPHCATAEKSIKSFLETHTDVEFSFYAFPLDPNCNKNFESDRKGPGFSCTLAAGVYCAQKQGKGVELHHDIFDNQNYYRKVAMTQNNEGLISQMENTLKGIDAEDWRNCLKSDETNNALIESAKLGKEVGVKGTPTVFMEDKKLNGGASYLVLKNAHRSLK